MVARSASAEGARRASNIDNMRVCMKTNPIPIPSTSTDNFGKIQENDQMNQGSWLAKHCTV